MTARCRWITTSGRTVAKPRRKPYQSSVTELWGLDSDKAVPADYDGDGRLDIAVNRPDNGVWYIRRSSGGVTITQFGIATDVPVPADYDGDGRADIAVYRSGIWYVNATTAGFSITQFGLAEDVPVPKSYLA